MTDDDIKLRVKTLGDLILVSLSQLSDRIDKLEKVKTHEVTNCGSTVKVHTWQELDDARVRSPGEAQWEDDVARYGRD